LITLLAEHQTLHRERMARKVIHDTRRLTLVVGGGDRVTVPDPSLAEQNARLRIREIGWTLLHRGGPNRLTAAYDAIWEQDNPLSAAWLVLQWDGIGDPVA
jgi:hypothetical protein